MSRDWAALGDVEERHEGSSEDLSRYRGRPVAFLRERRPGVVLLDWSREFLDAFHTRRQHVGLACNGASKTFTAILLADYFARVHPDALVVIFSATGKQLKISVLRGLRKLLAKEKFEVYNNGVTYPNGSAIALVAKGSAESLMASHAGALLVIADEAHGLTAEELEACMGNCTGAENYLVLLGNAIGHGTQLQRIMASGNDEWLRRTVPAEQILRDPAARGIDGIVTERWVKRMRQEWGEFSATFQSRVNCIFPSQAAEAMYRAAEIEAAVLRDDDGIFAAKHQRRWLAFGIDVGASEFGDETVCTIAKGGRVLQQLAWREADTTVSCARIVDLLTRYEVARTAPDISEAARSLFPDFAHGWARDGDPLRLGTQPATVYVDEVGVGKGLSDMLAAEGWPVVPFNAARRPSDDDAALKYANAKAESYQRLAHLLRAGAVSFPRDPMLVEELLDARGGTNAATGKFQISDKEETRKRLGRSPDRLESLLMAVAMPPRFELDDALATKAGGIVI